MHSHARDASLSVRITRRSGRELIRKQAMQVEKLRVDAGRRNERSSGYSLIQCLYGDKALGVCFVTGDFNVLLCSFSYRCA